jgi:hypothetical protein
MPVRRPAPPHFATTVAPAIREAQAAGAKPTRAGGTLREMPLALSRWPRISPIGERSVRSIDQPRLTLQIMATGKKHDRWGPIAMILGVAIGIIISVWWVRG